MEERKIIEKVIRRLEGEGYIMPFRAFHDPLYRMDVYVSLSVKLRGKKVAPYVSIIRLKPGSFLNTGYTSAEVLVPMEEVDALIGALKKAIENRLKALEIAGKIQAKVRMKWLMKGLSPEMKEELIRMVKEEL